MISRAYRDIIENFGWQIHEYDGGAELEQHSPAGEDFIFDISTDDCEDIAMQIFEYSEDFDAEEHAEMWIRARHTDPSVPKSIMALLDDAHEIKNMLSQLANALLDERYRYNPRTIPQYLRESLENGEISLYQAALELHKHGFTNYVDVDRARILLQE